MRTAPLARLASVAAATLLAACADGVGTAPSLTPSSLNTVASGPECATITFTGLPHVGPVSSVSALGVNFAVSGTAYAPPTGTNPNNTPIAWNTEAAGDWEDGDLLVGPAGTPAPGRRCAACAGLGTILVISDERNPLDNNFYGDSRWGGIMKFTAPAGSGPFYIKSYSAVDQEANAAGDELALYYDGMGGQVATATGLGDATVEQVAVPATARTFGSSFEFRLGTADADGTINSGGIDNVQVCRVTTPPPPKNPGTGTPGYWKNHASAWPTGGILLGGVLYDAEKAISLMQAPTKGDKTYNLFEHLAAATLNVAIGNADACIAADIAKANAWLAANPIEDTTKISAESAKWAEIAATFQRLVDYNEGKLCAPSRG
jgi:hypothetical protein